MTKIKNNPNLTIDPSIPKDWIEAQEADFSFPHTKAYINIKGCIITECDLYNNKTDIKLINGKVVKIDNTNRIQYESYIKDGWSENMIYIHLTAIVSFANKLNSYFINGNNNIKPKGFL